MANLSIDAWLGRGPAASRLARAAVVLTILWAAGMLTPLPGGSVVIRGVIAALLEAITLLFAAIAIYLWAVKKASYSLVAATAYAPALHLLYWLAQPELRAVAMLCATGLPLALLLRTFGVRFGIDELLVLLRAKLAPSSGSR